MKPLAPLTHKAVRRGVAGLAWLLLGCSAGVGATDSSDSADTASTRGVLRAEREAVLSSAVSERIQSMPFREGDSFEKGDVLVRFDCSKLAAELRAARAEAAIEARNAKVQAELLKMAATGSADADIAHYRQLQRAAQVQVIEQQVAACNVIAPYPGRVVETLARVDETPPANERLIKIVSRGPLELHMVVPSRWLAWMRSGSSLMFTVDETGDVLQAKVQRLSAAVDAVSQTIKIVARVERIPVAVLPGMSGQVTLDEATGASQAPLTQGRDDPGARTPALPQAAEAALARVQVRQ